MIDKILFGGLAIPGESIRVIIAFIGLLLTSYFDLFNNKNIPEKLLFLFLIFAFLLNLYFFDSTLSLFAIILSVVIGVVGYLFHKMGQLGSADVIVLSSVALLVPIHPSFSNMLFNYPFIFSLLVFSGVLFAIYILLNFSIKLSTVKKLNPDYRAIIILFPYLLFLYLYFQFPLFSYTYFIIVSLVIISSIFFMMFKKDINSLIVEKISLSKVEEEDVVDLEKIGKLRVKKFKIPRVISLKDIKRLKKLKVKTLWIYTQLPPFLPFLLVGFILSLYISNLLLS